MRIEFPRRGLLWYFMSSCYHKKRYCHNWVEVFTFISRIYIDKSFSKILLVKRYSHVRQTVRRACGHGDMGTGPHQVLAAILTLFRPGGTDYAHHILMYIENHRRTCVCNVCIKEVLLNVLHQSFCNWIY